MRVSGGHPVRSAAGGTTMSTCAQSPEAINSLAMSLTS